jgi:hypothetical protein
LTGAFHILFRQQLLTWEFFDSPATLLADTMSKFHGLCQATGRNEFLMLKKLAGCKSNPAEGV